MSLDDARRVKVQPAPQRKRDTEATMQGSAGRSVGEEMASQGLLATGTNGPEPYPDPYIPLHDLNPSLSDSSASLREAAAARVAAHRSRRAGAQAMEAAREEALRAQELEARAQIERVGRRGVSRVRDAVRARYENSQSYRDFLAAEAERATQHARAEAEIAARNARAIADAQLQLLEELRRQDSVDDAVILSDPERAKRAEGESKNPETPRTTSAASTLFHHEPHRSPPHHEHQPHTGNLFTEPEITEITTGGLTVRLYDDFGPALHSLPEITAPYAFADDTTLELEELDHEIAFRRAPDFVDHIIETLPLPANLIE
ncbi:MAG TPA: hypothetical protein VGL87_09620, partial [Steroidobacteraceae bacterium]